MLRSPKQLPPTHKQLMLQQLSVSRLSCELWPPCVWLMMMATTEAS